MEYSDHKNIKVLYDLWVKYDKAIKVMGYRGCNILEALSESIVIYMIKGLEKQQQGCGDAITEDSQIVEIKATSIENDLTTFSPKGVYCERIYK